MSCNADSIIALLYAIADRGPLYAYLLAARETLRSALSSEETPLRKISLSETESQAFSRVSEVIVWCIESVPVGYEQPLFLDSGLTPETTTPVRKDRPFPASTAGSEGYIELGKDLERVLGVEGKNLEIVGKAWKKLGQMISVRLRVGTQGTELEDGDPASMGRSVRSL